MIFNRVGAMAALFGLMFILLAVAFFGGGQIVIGEMVFSAIAAGLLFLEWGLMLISIALHPGAQNSLYSEALAGTRQPQSSWWVHSDRSDR